MFDKPRRYMEVLGPHQDLLEFHEGPGTWLETYNAAPEKPRTLFCVHWTHLEVFNGGFWQYFHNSTGVMAPEAVVAFEAIGMPGVAAVVGRAMSKLGQPYPREKPAREALVGVVGARRIDFTSKDDTFYELAHDTRIFFRAPRFVAFADAYVLADRSDGAARRQTRRS